MARRIASAQAGVAATALLVAAALATTAARALPCDGAPGPVAVGTAQWNGWGRDPDNSRYQPEPALRASDVGRLAVKWAYGFHGGEDAGPPSVVDGRLFFGDSAGHVHALDARTGCTYWTFEAGAGVLGAVTVGELAASRTLKSAAASQAPRPAKSRRHSKSAKHRGTNTDAHVEVLKAPSAAVFGDATGMIHALDAAQGTLLWQAPAQPKPATPLVGAPLIHGLTVLLSSCAPSAAGAVTALDVRTGRLLWSTPLDVRSGPAVDAGRQLVYVTTAGGIAALDLGDGRVRWQKAIAHADLRHAPILRLLAGSREVLIVAGSAGEVYGLDPAHTGEQLWEARVAGDHGDGQIDWGAAADHRNVYVGSAALGLTALDLATGRLRWNTPVPRAPSQAVTAIPGALFTGSVDGHLRAYSTIAGKPLWDVDTVHPYPSVSDSPANGGPPGHGGVVIVKGMAYLNAGTALLAFSIDGK
jgi:polyvinyl alcohol dehydrogenase (cytochrome)